MSTLGSASPANRDPLTERDRYYMQIAVAVRGPKGDPSERPFRGGANCTGSQVGAVLVFNDRILSTGYNGTPSDMTNCVEGGCARCNNREELGFESGSGLDRCLCVHAEQNALLTAARFGIRVGGATIYTTTKPCFGCLKECVQVGVERIVFEEDYPANYQPEIAAQYEAMVEFLRRRDARAFEELPALAAPA